MLNIMHVILNSVSSVFMWAHACGELASLPALKDKHLSLGQHKNLENWMTLWERGKFSLLCCEAWPASLGEACHIHRGKNNPSLFPSAIILIWKLTFTKQLLMLSCITKFSLQKPCLTTGAAADKQNAGGRCPTSALETLQPHCSSS